MLTHVNSQVHADSMSYVHLEAPPPKRKMKDPSFISQKKKKNHQREFKREKLWKVDSNEKIISLRFINH